MQRMLLIGLAGTLIVGCAKDKASVEALANKPALPQTHADAAPADPEEAAFEQLHAGTTQLDGAADSIEEALRSAEALKSNVAGAVKNALTDILDLIDSAGAGIADYTVDPPSQSEFKGDFQLYDDRRLKAIDAANDAHHEVLEALGIADALASDESVPKHKDFASLADLLEVAASDLEDAITALGGKVENVE